MAFHRRKLFNPSFDDRGDFCQPFCDEVKNPAGICPVTCMDLCFPTCKTPLFGFLTPPPPPSTADYDHPPTKHHGISLFLTIPLVIVSTIVFFLACYTIYRFYISLRRRRSQSQPGETETGFDNFLDEDRGPNQGPAVDHHIWYIRTIGLQPSVISAITLVKYKKGDGLIEGTDCSVCLNEFEEDETLRLLPKCSHAFHVPCIDTWLTSHTNCPTCRAGIMNNTAIAPSQELIVQNSGPSPVEENPAEISGIRVDSSARELGIEDSELGIGVENEANSPAQIGLNGLQPVRRSVSMDSLSASVVTVAIINGQPERNSDDQLVEAKELNGEIIAKRDGINQRLLRLVGSLSIGRTSCITRSLSCSANVTR